MPLLELPEDLKDLVKRGLLEPTKALELRKIPDEAERKARAYAVIQGRLSLKEIRRVSSPLPGSAVAASDSSLELELRQISLEASRVLGMRVEISSTQVRIDWSDVEGLNAILERLGVVV